MQNVQSQPLELTWIGQTMQANKPQNTSHLTRAISGFVLPPWDIKTFVTLPPYQEWQQGAYPMMKVRIIPPRHHLQQMHRKS